MERINFKQIFTGISISLFTLVALALISQMKSIETIATNFSKNLDTQLAKPISQTGEFNQPNQPDNVVEGMFNPNSDGNVVYYNEINLQEKFHYAAIRSDNLKNKDKQVGLMLQVSENGEKIWKETKWSWINYDQGILYFLLKTEENGIFTVADSYTGNYQLIFN